MKITQPRVARRGLPGVIAAPLEDADYEGHSLAMLQRVASALNTRIELRWVSLRRKPVFA